MNNCLKKVKRLVKKTCIRMLQHSLNEVKRFLYKIGAVTTYLAPGAAQNTGNPLLAILMTSFAPIRLLNLW